MRVFRRRAFGLAIPLFALFSLPAHSQNLLLNPGFDRDLSGWDVRTEFYPPANVDASAQWEATDVLGGASGSVRFRLHGGRQTVNRVQLTQCFPAAPGRRYTGGGLVRTDDELQHGVFVNVELFSTTGCSGDAVTSSSGGSLLAAGFTHVNSGGLWLPATASAVAGADGRSVRLSTGIYAATGSYYSSSSFDGLFDDAYLVEEVDPAATWILPAAGRGAGAAGSLWTTTLTLANPGPGDALVTLKFLGHDADGRSGPEKTVFVKGGSLLEYPDVLGTLFGRIQDYGAIRVTSSAANLVVQSETSTPSLGGTVGQALPAFGPSDFAGAAPKTLAPIRENAEFRTNLVLANPTEIPVTAHVELFPANGFSLGSLGSRDVELPPLGMTQINRVATALGATWQEPGYIAVSTPTPGGLVAAYASIIDNVTNDPRTLLPKGMAPTTPGPNLLANPGFDRDLAGWTRNLSIWGAPDVSSGWTTSDASGGATSGGLAVHAFADIHDGAQIDYRQCVPVVGGPLVTFGGTFRTTRQSGIASTGVDVYTYMSSDCSESAGSGYLDHASVNSLSGQTIGSWLPATSSAVIDFVARSMSVHVRASAYGNSSPYFPYRSASVDAVADDIFATVGPAPPTYWILPSAAWLHGVAHWTTRLTLCNPGWDASVVLEWLGHDSPGYNPFGGIRYDLPPRSTLTLDWETTYPETWGAIGVRSVWPISLPPVFLQSETTAPASGGTVGQALAALASPDLASALPKTLAPIRENASFRTNLVLAAATNFPVTAHVVLFAADGTTIGARDVDLPPLGMTQINRVASALGATTLDVGRISVSTATPGGLVAAYASVIDNVTNDPRTLLPR